MKKVAGLLMLIGLCFLVSMTLSAGPMWVANGFALDSALYETKIVVEEEVADFFGVSEIIANRGEPPTHRLGIRPFEAVCSPTAAGFITLIKPDAGFEAEFIEAVYSFGNGYTFLTAKITNNRDGSGRANARGCRS